MEKKQVKHDFGEQEVERINGDELAVWLSPKYIESKQKAIEMIDSELYDLTDGDFWILKNRTKTGKMAYTGLIISHNGCLKINDKLENKVDPKCFSLDKEGYNDSLVYTYIDKDTYEVGEFSKTNGQNAYPYAMAFKRCFDRVVLKKSRLAYSGIYSEVEADEFKQEQNTEISDFATKTQEIMELEIDLGLDHEKILEKFGVKSNRDLTNEQLDNLLNQLKKMKEGK